REGTTSPSSARRRRRKAWACSMSGDCEAVRTLSRVCSACPSIEAFGLAGAVLAIGAISLTQISRMSPISAASSPASAASPPVSPLPLVLSLVSDLLLALSPEPDLPLADLPVDLPFDLLLSPDPLLSPEPPPLTAE